MKSRFLSESARGFISSQDTRIIPLRSHSKIIHGGGVALETLCSILLNGEDGERGVRRCDEFSVNERRNPIRERAALLAARALYHGVFQLDPVSSSR